MAKENERVELREIDEEVDQNLRYVRLHKNTVEEVEELPRLRMEDKIGPLSKMPVGIRESPRLRPSEPNMSKLIDRNILQPEDLWEEAVVADRTLPWGWIGLIGCIFAAGIIWSLVSVKRAKEKNQILVEQAQVVIDKEKIEETDAEELIAALEKSVRNFFDSRSVDELQRYVRQPERVRPLMENYYAGKAVVPERVKSIIGYDPLTIDNLASFWMVSCELENGERKQLLVEVKSKTNAKVDWESYVCYQPLAWDEFAKSRPEDYTGDFRVLVERDHFYTNEFSDADSFLCFRLTALESEESLYGYVKRKSQLAQHLLELIEQNGDSPTPMILRLNVPKGVESKRGVIVQKLVNPRWMFVGNPGKEDL